MTNLVLIYHNKEVLSTIPSFVAIRLTVAELERHKINMNTKEKHIIRSILNSCPILA